MRQSSESEAPVAGDGTTCGRKYKLAGKNTKRSALRRVGHRVLSGTSLVAAGALWDALLLYDAVSGLPRFSLLSSLQRC